MVPGHCSQTHYNQVYTRQAEQKLTEYEDELMLAHPRIMAEIREAWMEYEAGENVKQGVCAH